MNAIKSNYIDMDYKPSAGTSMHVSSKFSLVIGYFQTLLEQMTSFKITDDILTRGTSNVKITLRPQLSMLWPKYEHRIYSVCDIEITSHNGLTRLSTTPLQVNMRWSGSITYVASIALLRNSFILFSLSKFRKRTDKFICHHTVSFAYRNVKVGISCRGIVNEVDQIGLKHGLPRIQPQTIAQTHTHLYIDLTEQYQFCHNPFMKMLSVIEIRNSHLDQLKDCQS